VQRDNAAVVQPGVAAYFVQDELSLARAFGEVEDFHLGKLVFQEGDYFLPVCKEYGSIFAAEDGTLASYELVELGVGGDYRYLAHAAESFQKNDGAWRLDKNGL